MVISDGERIARLEGIIEGLCNRLSDIENRLAALGCRMKVIENRMNVQIGLTVAMWISLVGLLVTVFLRQ